MSYRFWVDCFERELVIEFEENHDIGELDETAESSYLCWHDYESIEDEKYREYVKESCLEEYIVDCFKNLGYKVKDWRIEESEESK